jgi:hypothetical protein
MELLYIKLLMIQLIGSFYFFVTWEVFYFLFLIRVGLVKSIANINLPPTLIPVSGVGTTYFHHVVIKIQQLFLRPAACLTSTLKLEWVQTTANDQRLNVPSESWRSSR